MFFLLILLGISVFSQTLWIGYMNAGMGTEFTEKIESVYLSSGLSMNNAAISLNQGIGLNFVRTVKQIMLSLRIGVSASILFARTTDANAILLFGDGRIAIRYHHLGAFVGLTRMLVFLNATPNHIPNGGLFPEFGVGYTW